MVCLLLCVLFLACGGPEPRRPVEVRSGSFMKASVARNKELLSKEVSRIKAIMKQDSTHVYLSSAAGSWYYYDHKNETAAYTPRTGDLVTMRFNILSLNNDTIYSAAEIGNVDYLVDREDKDYLFPGLRNSVKLLEAGETATFLYPSSLAYGYQGDKNRIGPNIPVKSTITLMAITKQKDSILN